MEFTELSEKEFTTFANKCPLRTFMQTKEIAELRKINGFDVYYLGVKDNDKVVAASMVTAIKSHFGYYKFYSPRGLLVDYNNSDLLEFYVKELKKFVKSKKGYVLSIDPYIVYKQRDIDGNIVDDGINNEPIINKLKKLGFKLKKEKEFEQVSWMFALDTKDLTLEELFKNMKPNTRNNIRKLEKEPIYVRQLEYDELPIFMDVIKSTGERKSFSNRKIDYYQNMYKLFKDNVIYLVTEINFKEYVKQLEEKLNEKNDELNNLGDKAYNKGKKDALLKEIESINDKIKDAKENLNEVGEKAVLSAGMFILTKPEIIYLSSGNYDKYMKYKSMYLMQWEMIKYACNNGYDRYNFYGIPANINTHPDNYEIYEFKKGFNGYVEQLIGEFALPINLLYYLVRIIKKIKKNS